MKYDLTDCTFVIPFQADSPERMENLTTITRYLSKWFDTNIMVIEQSDTRSIWEPGTVDYVWVESKEHKFHRTAMLNLGFRRAKTPIVVNYDTDVLLPVNGYLKAVQMLKEDPSCVFSFPYDGKFYNLIGDTRKKVIETLDVETLNLGDGHWVHNNSLGGAFFADRAKYEEIGFENPNFVGWGYEDDERVTRAQKFGYSIKRAPYTLWHLDHPKKGVFYQSSENNPHVLNYIRRLTLDQLKTHIKRWNVDESSPVS